MLSDFTQNTWHVRGFPHKDVSVGVKEVGERAFLFEGKRGADAHHFALRAAGSMRTSLVPLAGLKDLVDRLGSGASSITSSLMVASSLEATIVVACSQHSTSHS